MASIVSYKFYVYSHALSSYPYRMGRAMGVMTPSLTMTLGLTESWNDSLVIHSGPTGSRRERSYCSLDSKGCGSCEARYLPFCDCQRDPWSSAVRKFMGMHVEWIGALVTLTVDKVSG